MLTSNGDPQIHGLTKQSGLSTLHGRATQQQQQQRDRNRNPTTRISHIPPALIGALSVTTHQKNPTALHTPPCHSGRRVVCPLRRVAKFRFDTRCQTDPAALPQFPRLAQHPPACSVLFFYPFFFPFVRLRFTLRLHLASLPPRNYATLRYPHGSERRRQDHARLRTAHHFLFCLPWLGLAYRSFTR